MPQDNRLEKARVIVAMMIIGSYLLLTAFLYWWPVGEGSANERLLIQQLGALGTALGVVVVSLFPQRQAADQATIQTLIEKQAPLPSVVALPGNGEAPAAIVIPAPIAAPEPVAPTAGEAVPVAAPGLDETQEIE